MRAFLEEYGIAIFVIAVIVILVVMATPVGAAIKKKDESVFRRIRHRNLRNCSYCNFSSYGNTGWSCY